MQEVEQEVSFIERSGELGVDSGVQVDLAQVEALSTWLAYASESSMVDVWLMSWSNPGDRDFRRATQSDDLHRCYLRQSSKASNLGWLKMQLASVPQNTSAELK